MFRFHAALAWAWIGLGVPVSALATPVVLIGDSITRGTVSGAPGPGYAEQLVPLLPVGHSVTNAGFSGSSAVLWDPDVVACSIYCTETPDLTLYELLAKEHVENAIASS